ncbi:hypothetical protein ACFWBH_37150 [Streptomyces sp. NPDC059999]|uniref:hypothetical protein n=1 Tax=Streptomyces sp. NPDC059999 TaxID=3347030 RepID=UPI003697E185
MAVVASELTSGIVKRAGDHRPGMPELTRCISDRFSTTGTPGTGLGVARPNATTLTVEGRPGTGALACARAATPGHLRAAGQEAGLVLPPSDNDMHCPDASSALSTGTVRTAAAIGGVDHGPEAAPSAVRALRAAAEQPLPDIVIVQHRALRHTRGASSSPIRLHAKRAKHRASRMATASHDGLHGRVTGQSGIVGRRRPASYAYRPLLPTGTALLLHTDGINPHTAAGFPLRPPMPPLVEAVARGPRRAGHHATVLTARPQVVTS